MLFRSDDDIIALSMSCFNNPWVDPKEVERTIAGMKDVLRVKREIHGEWVGNGYQLWKHFDPTKHLREGPWRDCSDWGLNNVTPAIGRVFWRRTDSNLKLVGGLDFNMFPMSLVLAQVCVPEGMDESNPENWILFVLDEIVKKVSGIREFAQYVSNKAGREKGLQADAFRGLPISCDSTGAQWKHPRITGISDKSTTLVKEMKKAGFDIRPCWLHPESGNPQNPAILDRVSLCHKLMSETVETPDGKVYPRLLIHATRCPELIRSLETQECDEIGRAHV